VDFHYCAAEDEFIVSGRYVGEAEIAQFIHRGRRHTMPAVLKVNRPRFFCVQSDDQPEDGFVM
jgi:hypothetical protein